MARKILVVDDSIINRKMLKKILGMDYSIMEAENGEEALDVLDREYKSISAVLLDIVMPGIDGYGVLKSIRSDKRYAKMPVIMITASDDETTRVKSLELSANDYVRKPYSPEILKHCLQNNIALSEAAARRPKTGSVQKRKAMMEPRFNLKALMAVLSIVTLMISILVRHFNIQADLRKTCENVTVEFTEIMDSYQHSFEMFELLLQEKIQTAGNADEIEAYLKTRDKRLLKIEGGDYDGVYMYYQGRYLYSWDTPYSAYADTGYDATKRPWYIGAVEANGEIFFSTPYPSYANDYMLATISRLQDDGETVIAYDIKLGEIGKYVNRLNLYKGSIALICDTDGNIIGSTDHLYLGGNYTRSTEQLSLAVDSARQQAGNDDAKNKAAIESAEAQQAFVTRDRKFLFGLRKHNGLMRYSHADFAFGFAYASDRYTCFVLTPLTTMLPQVAVLWAALLFVAISLALLIRKMMRRNHQILSDVLTGLSNRRAFNKYCNNHILHHSDECLGLLMLDLNHFKKINDLYGHSVGDQALLDAATVLKDACKDATEHFFLCRYGGDEFLLAARVADMTALDRMKELISDGFSKKNQTSMTPYLLEASMGASCGVCKDKRYVESLLKQADQSMYEDKRKNER